MENRPFRAALAAPPAPRAQAGTVAGSGTIVEKTPLSRLPRFTPKK